MYLLGPEFLKKYCKVKAVNGSGFYINHNLTDMILIYRVNNDDLNLVVPFKSLKLLNLRIQRQYRQKGLLACFPFIKFTGLNFITV